MHNPIELDALMATPDGKELFSQYMAPQIERMKKTQDEEERAVRLATIDELAKIEAENAAVTKVFENAKVGFENAQARLQKERDAVCKAEQKVWELSRQYNGVLKKLRECGEQTVIDAEKKLGARLAGLGEELTRISHH